MKNLWSIRMRASKTISSQLSALSSQLSALSSKKEIHISGAEGIYESSEIQGIVKRYIERALNHPKGKTDKIIITIENIRQRPKVISALPIVTISYNGQSEGGKISTALLRSLYISKRAIDIAFELIKEGSMRGAAIITSGKGSRLEPDKEKGVRVSRLGITKSALRLLSSRLSYHGINTDTVKEAVILASKVASLRDVMAELCVSDDPDYTTGYIASGKYGYIRIPHIKRRGSRRGGRAFFVKEGTNIERVIHCLERMPVIIGKVAECVGIKSLNEILNHPYQ